MNTDGNPRESNTRPWSYYDNQIRRPTAGWSFAPTRKGPTPEHDPQGTWPECGAVCVQVIRRDWWQDPQAPRTGMRPNW